MASPTLFVITKFDCTSSSSIFLFSEIVYNQGNIKLQKNEGQIQNTELEEKEATSLNDGQMDKTGKLSFATSDMFNSGIFTIVEQSVLQPSQGFVSLKNNLPQILHDFNYF